MNTRYFEEHGGYEYAKQFYEESYRFGCEIYGEENIVSAVMHADEINKAVSEELGKPVYHYHLHIVAIPTVRKEILWSKRCKDEALRCTVKDVINQVSHSKKWKNTVPLLDENGQQVISKYGKPMFRKSYSVLQDKLFAHMTEAGFTGFERGVLGSTAENLSSLDYQIQKDKERLAHIQERIEAEQVRYEPAHEVRKTMAEIEGMGQKTITGKIAISKDDYQQLTALAKEGITSRSEIQDLKSSVSYYQRQYFNASSAVERLQKRYDRLKEKCQPFLQALEHFPKLVEVFVEKVKELFSIKEAQECKERENRAAARPEKFNLESLAALTCTDELDLPSMGEKKVALYALIPDNDSSFNFLVSILYTQLFQQLFYSADHIHGGALPVPVHFLMDEFANVSLPDDFDKILSVMRSRGVSVSIILQNLAQLKALFEKQWESIDTNTFGKSTGRSGNYSTNYQISGRELLTPDEVRMLDNQYAILFIRGERPVMDFKYDILKHPNLALTTDGKAAAYKHGEVTVKHSTLSVLDIDPNEIPEVNYGETTYELLSDEDFEVNKNLF